MDSTLLLTLGYLGYISSQIPWTLIFLLTQFFGIRLYVLKDKEDCKRIQKRTASFSSHTADGNKGFGYTIGYWYLMSISVEIEDYEERYNIWLIATEDSYKELIKDKPEPVKVLDTPIEKSEITVYDRCGSFHNPYFKKRDIMFNKVYPRPEQDSIMRAIRDNQEQTEHTVVYLYGPPGSGKSLVGLLLANEYNGSYCNTLKPWQPGDTISLLYSEVEPTAENPLIVVFDEFDGALMQIHSGIESHKSLPTQVGNKSGWNQMLDTIQRGMYPHMILILTSNKDPDFICSLDPSYIREGRVDLTFELS